MDHGVYIEVRRQLPERSPSLYSSPPPSPSPFSSLPSPPSPSISPLTPSLFFSLSLPMWSQVRTSPGLATVPSSVNPSHWPPSTVFVVVLFFVFVFNDIGLITKNKAHSEIDTHGCEQDAHVT